MSRDSIKNTFKNKNNENGFTLVEVVIAMLIMLVSLLGVSIAFMFSVNFNAGNNSRSQALAILQREVENLRSAKFTPTITNSELIGGTKVPRLVTSFNGNQFLVQTVVDDDPFVGGVQVDNSKSIKEISVTVTLDSPTPGWQTSVPATVMMRRVRSN